MVKKKIQHVRYKISMGERIFIVANYIFLTLFALCTLYPILNVIAVSLSNYNEYLKAPGMIWPKGFTLEAYKLVLKNADFWRSYFNTIFIAGVYTLLGLTVNLLYAWSMARKETKGKPFFIGLLIFTMMFSAGMIPNYLNMQSLGLLNSLWVLILPGAFTAFNCVIMMSFLRELPYELVEAAMADGASEPYILTKIIVPLSKPVLASIALFLVVGSWNSYFGAQIYLRDRELWPVSLVLKDILQTSSTAILEGSMDPLALEAAQATIRSKTIQYASVVISTVPIMCVYPFLQKYFAKGVMVGGVKG